MAHNAECIHAAYATDRIGRQLVDIGERLLAADTDRVDGLDDAGLILDRFLDLNRLRLIRGMP